LNEMFKKAVKLSNHGQIDEAMRVLRTLVDKRADLNPIVHYEYVRHTLLCYRIEEAKSRYFGPNAFSIPTESLLVGRATTEFFANKPWRALEQIIRARKTQRGESLLDYIEAKVWSKYGKYDKVVNLYLQALKNCQLRWSILFNLTDMKIQDAKKLEEVKTICHRAVTERWPTDQACFEVINRAYVVLWLAQRLHFAAKHNEAEQIMDVLDSSRPSSCEKLCQAVWQVELGNFECAAGLFESVTSEDNWRRTCWRFNEISKAIRTLTKKLPKNLLLRCRYAECLAVQGQHEKALDIARKVLLEGTSCSSIANRVITDVLRTRRIEEPKLRSRYIQELIEHLEKWIFTHPDDEDSHCKLLELYRVVHGSLSWVDAFLRTCRRKWPDSAWPFVQRGLLQIEHRPKAALKSFEYALHIGSDKPLLLRAYGKALWHCGRRKQAVQVFEHLWNTSPAECDPYEEILDCVRELNDVCYGYKWFMRIMALEWEHATQIISSENVAFVSSFAQNHWNDELFQFYISLCLSCEEQLDEAIRCVERALELCPDFADAYVHYARVLYLTERKDKAGNAYKTALSKDPFNIGALKYMGIHLAAEGKLEEALKLFIKCDTLKPNDEEFEYLAIRAAIEAGKKDDVVDLIARNSKSVRKARAKLLRDQQKMRWWD